MILNTSDLGFFCLTNSLLQSLTPCTYCSACGRLDGYGKNTIFWFGSTILYTWIWVYFSSPCKMLVCSLFPYTPYFLYYWPFLLFFVFCHVDLCFPDAVVPVIECKPLVEAILVRLNREKLISHVLRLIFLFIYLNIITFYKAEQY